MKFTRLIDMPKQKQVEHNSKSHVLREIQRHAMYWNMDYKHLNQLITLVESIRECTHKSVAE